MHTGRTLDSGTAKLSVTLHLSRAVRVPRLSPIHSPGLGCHVDIHPSHSQLSASILVAQHGYDNAHSYLGHDGLAEADQEGFVHRRWGDEESDDGYAGFTQLSSVYFLPAAL